jgi:hypothetical protein
MDRTQHELLAMHAAEYAAVSERVLREGYASRPDNTTKAYAPVQKRWKVRMLFIYTRTTRDANLT